MQKTLTALFSLAALLLLFSGCKKDKNEDPVGPDPNDQLQITDINVDTRMTGG